MDSNAPAALRTLLAEPGLPRAPEVFEGLGARLVRRSGFVVEASGLPVIADADTGYGNAVDVAHTDARGPAGIDEAIAVLCTG